ncbi:MAG: NERD domain-containing protein [Salinibacterium sp.]|nr:NERD domain-containing protein [Salinibacterium sp.]
MIAKEKTFTPSRNVQQQAGDAAEKQMAFYLRRQFGDHEKNVRVFNDLRLVHNDEAAQIDHLLMHKHGMIIIESKSVTSEIRVNPDLEFERMYRGKASGMKSPILQAKLQGELLRLLLNANAESLREKKVFGLKQGGFKSCPMDLLVAISDKGRIVRKGKVSLPELKKADQIPDAAHELMERHRKGAKLLSDDGNWGVYSFTPGEMERITTFLLENHTPLRPEDAESADAAPVPAATPKPAPRSTSTPKAAPAPPRSLPTFLCSKCHSTNLVALFGRSYYFKCLDCHANTPIKNPCRSCGAITRTRKSKLEFRAECEACGLAEVFFVNSADSG